MIDFSVTFFITIINLLFLYFVLRRVLFKPVTKFMEDRTARIQNDLDMAKKATARAEALQSEFEGLMKNAQEEGRKIVKMSQDKAHQEYAEIIAQAKAEAAKIIDSSRHNLEEERRHAEKVLRKDASNISIQAASRVIGENLDSDKNRRLVEKFLESIGVA